MWEGGREGGGVEVVWVWYVKRVEGGDSDGVRCGREGGREGEAVRV